MKTFGTKKNVLIGSTIGTLFVVLLFVLTMDLCYENILCRTLQNAFSNDNLLIVLLFPPVMLFSLLTYRMHDDIFRAWWNFARWMVPIIMFASIAIQFVPSNGGFFNMDGLIYLFVLAPLYAVLTLVSLWRIFRKYRELKKAGK